MSLTRGLATFGSYGRISVCDDPGGIRVISPPMKSPSGLAILEKRKRWHSVPEGRTENGIKLPT